jgi:hypothetical protein
MSPDATGRCNAVASAGEECVVFQAAPRIPFRPQHCPQCRWYIARLHRCRAITSEPTLDLRPLLAEYKGESRVPCNQYDPVR